MTKETEQTGERKKGVGKEEETDGKPTDLGSPKESWMRVLEETHNSRKDKEGTDADMTDHKHRVWRTIKTQI